MSQPQPDPGLPLLRQMLFLRGVMERLMALHKQGLVHGPMHLGVGQEAIAAGVAAALRPDDCALGTYRGHAQAIARGAPADAVVAEVLGRKTGVCGGKGGSMHITSLPHWHGSYAIVGAQLPIACGLAWAARLRKTDQVTACFFGDGTVNIGAFHEALNLAAVWKLPVIFVCENNQYMEYTPIASVIPVARPAADRASAYGLLPVAIDGNDVELVRDTVLEQVARARKGEGPALIEALTYRHHGHSAADPAKYRPELEVAQWMQKDPIARQRERLLGRGVPAAALESAETSALAEAAAHVERAVAAPPADAAVEDGLWATGGSSWRR